MESFNSFPSISHVEQGDINMLDVVPNGKYHGCVRKLLHIKDIVFPTFLLYLWGHSFLLSWHMVRWLHAWLTCIVERLK
jgi:hypothetical protein